MKKGFTLIEILIVAGVTAVISAVIMVNVIRTDRDAKTRQAWVNLNSVSAAIETYHNRNEIYPTSLNTLVNATPFSLDRNYCTDPASTINGYKYYCTLNEDGYTINAEQQVSDPKWLITVETGGDFIFSQSIGGVLTISPISPCSVPYVPPPPGTLPPSGGGKGIKIVK